MPWSGCCGRARAR
uniref:Uncharacterized protein n=1 Tax=Arundo donax TaxID=35708 RepID=A0A0A9BNG6_ARUDO